MIYYVITRNCPIERFHERLRGVPPTRIKYVLRARDLMGVDLAGQTVILPYTEFVVRKEDARFERDRLISFLP